MKIYRQEHSEVYNKFSKLLRQETVAIKKYDNITSYFVAEIDEEMVGVVGWQQMKNGHFITVNQEKTSFLNQELFRGGNFTKI